VLREDALSQMVQKGTENKAEDSEMHVDSTTPENHDAEMVQISYYKRMVYLKKKVKAQLRGPDP